MSKFLLATCLLLATLPAFAQSNAATSPPAAATSHSTENAATADAARAADAADAAMQDKAIALAVQLDRLLAPSRSPRDQALRWDHERWQAMAGAGTGTARASLREAAKSGASDRLVQWMWARATSAESGCAGEHSCPGREQALAKLEPDNGAAWLPVLEQAWDAEDEAGIDAALSRVAHASRFDDLFAEYVGAWTELENRFPEYVAARSAVWIDPQLKSSLDVTGMVIGIARGAASAIPSMGTLVNVCDRGKHPEAADARFQECAAIGRLMFGKATTVNSRNFGYAVVRRSVGATDQDRAANRLLLWRVQQSVDVRLDQAKPEQFRRYFADLVESGDELTAIHRLLVRNGKSPTPPAGWKAPGED